MGLYLTCNIVTHGPLVDANCHKSPTSGPVHKVVSINRAFMQSLGFCAALECKEQEKMDTEGTDFLHFFIFLGNKQQVRIHPSLSPQSI